VGDGESLGLGDVVSVVLADGLGEGDGEVVGELLGDGVPDCDGDALPDGLPDSAPALQLDDAVADGLPLWPSGPPPPLTPPEFPDDGGLVLELPGGRLLDLPAASMNCGRAVIAQDAPVTTSSVVASAAAGRNQPTHPEARASGRNRSITAP
jgi:hypothetical protein